MKILLTALACIVLTTLILSMEPPADTKNGHPITNCQKGGWHWNAPPPPQATTGNQRYCDYCQCEVITWLD